MEEWYNVYIECTVKSLLCHYLSLGDFFVSVMLNQKSMTISDQEVV